MAKEAYYYKENDGVLYEFDKDKNFIPSEDVIFLWKGEGWDDNSLIAYGSGSTSSNSSSRSSSSSSSSASKRRQLRDEYDAKVQTAERDLRQYREELEADSAGDYREAYVDMRKNQVSVSDYAAASGMRGGMAQRRREQIVAAYESAVTKIRDEQNAKLTKATQEKENKVASYREQYDRSLSSL